MGSNVAILHFTTVMSSLQCTHCVTLQVACFCPLAVTAGVQLLIGTSLHRATLSCTQSNESIAVQFQLWCYWTLQGCLVKSSSCWCLAAHGQHRGYTASSLRGVAAVVQLLIVMGNTVAAVCSCSRVTAAANMVLIWQLLCNRVAPCVKLQQSDGLCLAANIVLAATVLSCIRVAARQQLLCQAAHVQLLILYLQLLY